MLDRGWRLFAIMVNYLVYGLGSLSLWYLIYPCTAWRVAAGRREDYARLLSRRAFRFFIRFMALTGIWRYRIDGARRLAVPGRVIVANHPSFLDVVLLFALVENAVCIVKPGLARVPLVREPIRRCGHVVADQPEEVVGKSVRALRRGASLILFPQGTRTPEGVPVRFHRSAARIALEAGVPVVPVYFRYRPSLLGKGEQWYNVPPTRPQVQVSVGEEIVPRRGSEPLSLASRRLTRRLESWFEAWERDSGSVGK